MKTIIVVSSMVLGLCLAGVGCAARVYTPSGRVVVNAPPPARYEVVPVAPGPAYVWVGGYWDYGGGAYVWRPGHHVRAPRAGVVYRRPHWVRSGRAYRFVPGRWVARGRAAPPPPAYRSRR